MNKLKEMLAKDLWVVLLDLAAVNVSYYFAFLFRFYVNLKLGLENAETYKVVYLQFAPWYSVLAIIVFMCFRLYGGLWRYAGINDMNRIVGANICTTVLYIAGTALLLKRMPLSYYGVGALLQLIMIVMIRFGHRILLVEKRKLRHRGLTRIRTVVVGSGENGHRVVKTLEENDAYRPVLVVGNKTGVMDGIPVTTLEHVDWENIGAVFLAEPLLSSAKRDRIKALAGNVNAEVHEYTGYFSNLGGNLSVTELLATIHSPLILSVNGEEKEYRSGAMALAALTDTYDVSGIEAEKIKITLVPQKKLTKQEMLAQAYAALMEEESYSASASADRQEKSGEHNGGTQG